MRELVILVADGTIEAVFRAFFGRERWDLTLQCAQFDLWPEEDIFHDPLHTDGGVHKSAQELLRPYLNTHSRAMVVLDQQFGGGLPAAEVRQDILARLYQNGWNDRCEVVVIDPELEVWLWQISPHVERALMFSGGSLRQHLPEQRAVAGRCAETTRAQEDYPGTGQGEEGAENEGRLLTHCSLDLDPRLRRCVF